MSAGGSADETQDEKERPLVTEGRSQGRVSLLRGWGWVGGNALRDLEQESPLCGPRFLCLGRGMEPAGVAPCLRRLRILVLGITKGKHLKLWL